MKGLIVVMFLFISFNWKSQEILESEIMTAFERYDTTLNGFIYLGEGDEVAWVYQYWGDTLIKLIDTTGRYYCNYWVDQFRVNSDSTYTVNAYCHNERVILNLYNEDGYDYFEIYYVDNKTRGRFRSKYKLK